MMYYEFRKVVEKSPCGRFVRYTTLLGGGANKDVYLGYDHVEKIDIAWNQIVLCGEDEGLKSSEEMFGEAILLKSLSHERVMKCFSYWFDSESKTLNMITELFSAGSLKEYLSNYDDSIGVDLARIKNWGTQILEGLNFLHTQNPKIIHRDIKCDNLFVDNGGKQIKLGDFGLGVRITEGNFVRVKEAKGTPEFMAPECYDGEYNELVDIYSFGMCLLEMVTGEHPYMECNNRIHVFKRVYSGVKPASLGRVKDSNVKAIIEKCILPMSDRPSAEELLKDPFFSYNGSSSTLEVNSVISHPLRGIHCCARDIRNLYLV